MEHKQVKSRLLEEAKAMGIKGNEIRVLSTDPYFVGTEKDYQDAQWVATLWDKMMAKRRKPLHLRGFHYWIQSQGIPKPNGEKYAYGDPAKDWGYTLHSAQVARYLGIGGWQGLLDLKHPDPVDFDNYWVGSGLAKDGQIDIQLALNAKLEGLVDEFIRELTWQSPKYHSEGYQTYHLEVMCEKNSMGFVIEPVCKKLNACYQPFVGQASVEKIQMMANRAVKAARAGKKVRLFYIADWDRYGWSMVAAVARKIEFMTLGEENIDIKLTRLALNDDQVQRFNLPKAPKHGEAVVELDALEAIHPGALGTIVEEALAPYYDEDKPKVVDQENKRMREAVRQILETNLRLPLQDAFQEVDIASIAGEVSLASAIDPGFEPPVPGHEVDDGGRTWVYSSDRGYWDQWEEYRKYKEERQEESV